MNEDSIIVEADYNTKSLWVDCEYIKLTEEEIDLLSTAIWTFYYETSGIKLERPTKKLVWQFSIICSDFLNITAMKLLKIIQELFPDKLVEFSEENKYD